MKPARDPEQRAAYRFFRSLTVYSSRFTVAGLFFIAWTVLSWLLGTLTGQEARTTAVFLGGTTVLLLFVSLVSATVAYMLYKRGGGTIEKGPRSASELMGTSPSEAPGEGQRGEHVPRDQHQG